VERYSHTFASQTQIPPKKDPLQIFYSFQLTLQNKKQVKKSVKFNIYIINCILCLPVYPRYPKVEISPLYASRPMIEQGAARVSPEMRLKKPKKSLSSKPSKQD